MERPLEKSGMVRRRARRFFGVMASFLRRMALTFLSYNPATARCRSRVVSILKKKLFLSYDGPNASSAENIRRDIL